MPWCTTYFDILNRLGVTHEMRDGQTAVAALHGRPRNRCP